MKKGPQAVRGREGNGGCKGESLLGRKVRLREGPEVGKGWVCLNTIGIWWNRSILDGEESPVS